jgi:hypothetical protein
MQANYTRGSQSGGTVAFAQALHFDDEDQAGFLRFWEQELAPKLRRL